MSRKGLQVRRLRTEDMVFSRQHVFGSSRRRLHARLQVEQLEDRCLLDASSLLIQLQPDARLDASALIPDELASALSLEATYVPGLFVARGPDADLNALASRVGQQGAVAYTEFSQTLSISLSPNDPRFLDNTLWGMNGTFGIRAPAAWDQTTGATNVTVAVIDTGIDYRHPDLYKNIWINQGEIPSSVRTAIQSDPTWDIDNDGLITFWDLADPRNQGPGEISDLDADGRITGADILLPVAQGGWANGVSDDGLPLIDDLIGWNFVNNTNNPLDDHGHGTHVAGTIGAIGNNAVGVVGVNWKTQLMAMKFLSASGSGSSANAAQSVTYSKDHGARVSNNSWGGGGGTTLGNAVAAAISAGQVFVAAAGNESANNDVVPSYPASYTDVVAVAATTSGGGLASFSNYGLTSVELGAPGSGIFSTLPNNTYGSASGTSMASPHVAGVVALILSQHPTWTVTQVVNRLLTSITPLSSLAGKTVTGGLVNASLAVDAVMDLNWIGGGVTAPTSVAALTNFTMSRTYNVAGAAAPMSFRIAYYASTDPTLSADDLLLNTETVSGAANLSLGLHSGTSPNLQIGQSGTYYLFVRLDSNNDIAETSETNNNAQPSSSIAVSGPTTQIIDNGDATFSTVGQWTLWTGQGFQNDVHEAYAGNGSKVASWTFAITPGIYRVSATWSPYVNRATNSPFTIVDGGNPLATVLINQQLAPNDFSAAGAVWEDLGGPYNVANSTLVVRLTDNANGNLNADAIRIERLSGLPQGPEIQVLDGATDVPDGTGNVSFGTTTPGTPVSKTFTVKNLGNQDLLLATPISVPAGYTLTSSFGATTLAPGGTTTFVVRLDAAAAGAYSGQVSFGNNDADENPFDFTVTGTVAAPASIAIIDNGDAGFSTVGQWTLWGGQGFQNDVHEAHPGNGAQVATWTFAVTPGLYRVSATWSEYINRATNSPFTVLDGGTALATVLINQQLAPNDFSAAGAVWEDLGGPYTVAGSSLVVRLADNANGNLIADAVRVERLGAVPQGPEIQVLDGNTNIVDDIGSVDFGNTPPGFPLSRTFTVKNVGNQDLTLGSAISVPAGYTVSAGFGATTVAPGGSTTFVVRLDAAVVGTFTGQVSFANNDSDENPFNFNVTSTVSTPPAIQIIDNGDAGFSTVGQWTLWGGQGFQNDVHEAHPGNGSQVATWTFTVTPGVYQVAATWSEYINRATNSPFAIYDTTTLVSSVLINQQLAPNDFVAVGANWEILAGAVTITGGSLVVKLSDNANGNLNADAIRIERQSGGSSLLGLMLPPEPAAPEAPAALDGLAGPPSFGELAPELAAAVHASSLLTPTVFAAQTALDLSPLEVSDPKAVDALLALLTYPSGARDVLDHLDPSIVGALPAVPWEEVLRIL